MTIGQIALVLAFIAGILTSILVIWVFSSKVKAAHDGNIKSIVKATLDEYDEKIDKKIKKELDNISHDLRNYIKEQKETNRHDTAAIDLLKVSLVESYKQDIRDIYYRLRQTGEISDADKSYVDKLFPKYVALGGNSDIEAKYTEMCRVYETITQEAFKKARAKHMADRHRSAEYTYSKDKGDNNNEQKTNE